MSDKQEKLDILCDFLIAENAKYNLTRIVEPSDIAIKHFQDSLIVLDMLNEYAAGKDYRPELIDIGSGAGFPSLALAIMLDNWNFTSVDSTGKKVKFQQAAAEELGLKNFKAICDRAEELGNDQSYRGKYDVATARAVGHLAMIAELSVPFLKSDGMFLAWKGPKVMEELPLAEERLKALGATQPEKISYQLGSGEDVSELFIIKAIKVGFTPAIYPRQFGIIKKSLK